MKYKCRFTVKVNYSNIAHLVSKQAFKGTYFCGDEPFFCHCFLYNLWKEIILMSLFLFNNQIILSKISVQ